MRGLFVSIFIYFLLLLHKQSQMKKTILNKSWIFNKQNKFCGVDMGSDFCTEHETGIGLIKAAFGIDGIVKKKITKLFGVPVRTTLEPNFGIASRIITKIPANFTNGIAGKYRFIGYYDTVFDKWIDTLVKDAVKESMSRKCEFVAYWCDHGFLLVSADQEKMIALRDAFKDGDMSIFLGNSNFISNKGLVLCMVTKMDQDILDKMRDNDKASYELSRLALETGIVDRLKKAGKTYFALTPKWKDDTHKEVIFWLNPDNQREYDSGHYTVDELDLWIKNEGPVIIKNKKNGSN